MSSIAISPDPVYIGIGTTLQLAATGTYSNGTTADLTSQVTWTSANSAVATVAASGVVNAVGASGATTTISASLGSVIAPAVTLTITSAVSVSSYGLNFARYDHTATLLNDGTGRVLVAGGYNNVALASAELYDPATAKWITTNGNMGVGRRDHTATLLSTGQVLLIGGGTASGDLDSAELYTPSTDTWVSYPHILTTTRSYHTATLLNPLVNGGKDLVLVVGGSVPAPGSTAITADLYEPSIAASAVAVPDSSPRYSHTATLLANNSVLVAGGFDSAAASVLATAELFDPMGTTEQQTDNLKTGRYLHSATLLQDGRVLVVGGLDALGNALASAELYDPTAASGSKWTSTGNLTIPRFGHIATLMPNGQVLVMGGRNASNPTLSSAEIYDSATGKWSGTANLQTGRAVYSATLLNKGTNAGSVLVVGGEGTVNGNYVVLSSVEIHN
ncbi:kelch motif protein [mine drainage metagenome]|uniref:Kelch motif protein n=1 Tax=mine drainage metagenome TaxID=410659 RepID=A0A1J5TAE2_9ZZZZ